MASRIFGELSRRNGGVGPSLEELWANVIDQAVYDIRKIGNEQSMTSNCWKLNESEKISAVRFIYDDDYEISDGLYSSDVISIFPKVSEQIDSIRNMLYKEKEHCLEFITILKNFCINWYEAERPNRRK